jgi:hypothetical protein
MSILHTSATTFVSAPADRVYALLRDYHGGHARILPPRWFSGMHVEEGGTGAGTRLRVHMRVLGRERVMRMEVTEPDPGRVLAERDVDTGAVTTFRVAPSGGGTRVTIATEWMPARGVRGWMERRTAPRLLRRIYAEELQRLVDALREEPAGP